MKLPMRWVYDLWALTQQGPAEELNKTWQTQPALLTASVALCASGSRRAAKRPCSRAIAWVNILHWSVPV